MSQLDQHLIKIIDAHKSEIKERFDVKSLAIFGSVVKGTAKPDSDIDILVNYRTTPGLFGFIDLKHYLELLVGRSVDLVTEKALKKQLRDKILKEAVRVA